MSQAQRVRGASVRRLIGKSPLARAFVSETRPQGHHGSGFLKSCGRAGPLRLVHCRLLSKTVQDSERFAEGENPPLVYKTLEAHVLFLGAEKISPAIGDFARRSGIADRQLDPAQRLAADLDPRAASHALFRYDEHLKIVGRQCVLAAELSEAAAKDVHLGYTRYPRSLAAISGDNIKISIPNGSSPPSGRL